MILEPPKIKSVTVSIVSPSLCHEVMRPDAMILVFWMLSFKPTFPLSNQRKLNMLPKPVKEHVLLLVSPYPAIPRQLPPITAHLTPSLFHYEACLLLPDCESPSDASGGSKFWRSSLFCLFLFGRSSFISAHSVRFLCGEGWVTSPTKGLCVWWCVTSCLTLWEAPNCPPNFDP